MWFFTGNCVDGTRLRCCASSLGVLPSWAAQGSQGSSVCRCHGSSAASDVRENLAVLRGSDTLAARPRPRASSLRRGDRRQAGRQVCGCAVGPSAEQMENKNGSVVGSCSLG